HEKARTPHQSQKLVRIGFRSHEKLVELIESGDGPGAEAHWVNHMAAAGDFWLKNVAKTAVVDVLE
ncbi:MAG: GntR family transcriptional regulator, partial [Ignavibacteriales bacterium]